MEEANMIVLVTGATGGFGSVLARVLADEGLRVYGTGRSPGEQDPDSPVRMIAMDVAREDTIAAAVREVTDREGRIDVVVNCVNEMVIGTIEEQSADEVAQLYDTNVFGALRVWQQVLPVMRAQDEGLIISMSSLGGLLAVPTMSAYTSSKFALEAMSEALYHELRDTGIDVVIMQPVAMRMDRPATGSHLHTVAKVAPGSRSLKMVERMATDTAASGLTPEAVARRVLEVIRSNKRSLRVPMDRAKPLSIVKRLAPQAVIDRMIDGLLR
jgi:short-subunit dehydrogenase